MQLNFSDKAIEILKKVKIFSDEKKIAKIGTEYLLHAMFEIEDSLCRFLFNEYKVLLSELIEEEDKLIIIRKNDKEYTNVFENIMKQAQALANDLTVSDEHIFYAMLLNKDCIGNFLLENLGLDLEELILDVKEIYDFNQKSEELEYTKNITKLAKNKELNAFVDRSYYIERLQVILNRKLKNNPILIGNAGVGKTALVEGLAKHFIEHGIKDEIISLNLGSMLAGTKYRGDFEQRLDNIIKDISKKKNVILFIDEIHTIVGAGTTEGSLDVANMLKPFLARNDFKLIGATTPAEYHKTIEKDKALNRRFQTIFIKEPSVSETIEILKGIKESYEEYHQTKVSNEMIEYIVHEADRRILKRFRPDKAIDVLDEALASNKTQNTHTLSILDVDNAIDNILCFKMDSNVEDLHFKELEKYRYLYEAGLLINKVLLSIDYQGNMNGLNDLNLDLMNIFGITEEMILEIDLSSYSEYHNIASLIGAPPGYVGYEDEGLLSTHILKYPINIVIVKNFSRGHVVVQNLFNSILGKGSFYDKKGNLINCNNTILIICNKLESKNGLGFINQPNPTDDIFDEHLSYHEEDKQNYDTLFVKALKKYNLDIFFDFVVTKDKMKALNILISDLLKNRITGKYCIYEENSIYKYKAIEY